MARSPQLFLPGFAQHIIQRGNNRQACFCSDDDYAAYHGGGGIRLGMQNPLEISKTSRKK